MLLFSFNKTPIPESRWIPWESIPGVSRNVSHYSHCAAHCSVRGKWCNSFALDQGNCTLSRVGRESGERGGGKDIDVYVAESDSRGELYVRWMYSCYAKKCNVQYRAYYSILFQKEFFSPWSQVITTPLSVTTEDVTIWLGCPNCQHKLLGCVRMQPNRNRVYLLSCSNSTY